MTFMAKEEAFSSQFEPKPKSKSASNSDELTDKFQQSQDEWTLDSGCFKHMTGNRRKLSSLKLKELGIIYFRNNDKLKVLE